MAADAEAAVRIRRLGGFELAVDGELSDRGLPVRALVRDRRRGRSVSATTSSLASVEMSPA